MKHFYAISLTFEKMEQFVKDCEKIGWRYNHEFTKFNMNGWNTYRVLMFSNQWNGVSAPNTFSLTNLGGDGGKIYNLSDTDEYQNALQMAREQYTAPYRIGDRFKCIKQVLATSDEEYILAQVDFGRVCLIGLKCGNRKKDSVKVVDVYSITQIEFEEIGGINAKHFVKI